MKYELADDIKKEITNIVYMLDLDYIDVERIACVRSFGSTSDAIARIWSMPKVWQIAFGMEPKYVVEIISEKFDKMGVEDRRRTLIHELMHIPKTFSGALLSHNAVHFDGMGGHVRRKIDRRTVEKIYNEYVRRINQNTRK